MTDRRTTHHGKEIFEPSPFIPPIIDDFITEKSITVLCADAGQGKTSLAVCAALAVATGSPFLNKLTVQRPVLYINEEMAPENFKDWRLLPTLKGMDLGEDAVENIHWLSKPGYDFFNDDDIQEVIDKLLEVKAGFLVTDTLSSIMGNRNLSEAMDIALLFSRLEDIVEETNTAILLNHHENRGGSYLGSALLKAKTDNLWLMTADKHKVKNGEYSNLTIHLDKVRLGVERIEYGKITYVTDDHRNPITIVLSPDRKDSKIGSLTGSKRSDYDFILRAGRVTLAEIAANDRSVTHDTHKTIVARLIKDGLVKNLSARKPPAIYAVTSDE